MKLPPEAAARTDPGQAWLEETLRLAVLSGVRLSLPGTPDGVWNNTARRLRPA